MHKSYQHTRCSLNAIRAHHASCADARHAWGDDAGLLISNLGRLAWHVSPPRCIYRRRYARWARAREARGAWLATLPPPPEPPAGYVHGFANGTEYELWTHYNCDGCALAGDPGEAGSSRCELFEAIHDADDGLFPIDIARRMGWLDSAAGEINRCPERRGAARNEEEDNATPQS